MRTRLIFNPTSNQGLSASFLPVVEQSIAGSTEMELSITREHGHATILAQNAAEAGFERVIALGGDGTTHEVVNGLMQIPEVQRPDLGIVPLGSGNDFSFAGGLHGTAEDLLALAQSSPSRSVDIGVVEDDLGRKEYWVNSLGIGFDALINIYSRELRWFKGFWVYLIAALRAILFNYTSFHFEARKDGLEWQETLLMLIIANGVREGGKFMIAPDGSLNDNTLSYSAVQLISRPNMLRALTAYMKGRQNDLPFVRSGSFNSLDLQSDAPLIIHTDGEIFAGLDSKVTRLKVSSVPAAIRLVCRSSETHA